MGTIMQGEAPLIIKEVPKALSTRLQRKGIVVKIMIANNRRVGSNIKEEAAALTPGTEEIGLRPVILIHTTKLFTKFEVQIKPRKISKNPKLTHIEVEQEARLNNLIRVVGIHKIKDTLLLR